MAVRDAAQVEIAAQRVQPCRMAGRDTAVELLEGQPTHPTPTVDVGGALLAQLADPGGAAPLRFSSRLHECTIASQNGA
jgi:hypothetical protein